MLFALTLTFTVVPIVFSVFVIFMILENRRKGLKLLSPDIKAFIAFVVISLVLIAPLHFAQDAVAKNIETELSITELDSENCYMVTSMSKNGNTLFICKENDGEFCYVWAKHKETDSKPCLETCTYKMSRLEKILTYQVENTYVISTNSQYIKHVYDINDVPINELS